MGSSDGQLLHLQSCLGRIQPSEKSVISQLYVVCRARDVVVLREVPLEKNLDLKLVHKNVLNSITKMTKRAGGVRSE